MNRTGWKARTFDGIEYAPGGRFRVIREGARLTWWNSDGTGDDRELKVGEVIQCAGYGPGWGSDPGYGIHFYNPARVEPCEFRPSTFSPVSSRPLPGYLEPVTDEEDEAGE